MRKYLNMSIFVVFILLLSACTTNGQKTASDSSTTGIQTETVGAMSEQGDSAASVTISRATVEVSAIDMNTRLVTLKPMNGSSFVVEAGER